MHNVYDYQKLASIVNAKGVKNPAVLQAIATIPRHRFMPSDIQHYATNDTALPIGHEQTISQPTVVARMTEILLEHTPLHRVLEIGTGSGYQAAILAQVADEVYTVERIQALHLQATALFATLGLKNVHTRYGDGHNGWQAHAPYDGIIVTAACEQVPPALLEQLAEGANLIIPLGSQVAQELVCFTKRKGYIHTQRLDDVIFVPMRTGTQSGESSS